MIFKGKDDRRTEPRRAINSPGVVVDIPGGVAREGRVAWKKGHEAGLRITAESRLGGLVSQRFAPARDAWRRAGGR